jgi:hypothetical protein
MPARLAQPRPIEHTASAAVSPQEAAAIAAAIEQFMRATAPAIGPAAPSVEDAWRRTAIVEGVQRVDADVAAHPWLHAD